MSVFDFPRINVKGLVQINVGTANNDDYSLQNGKPGTYTGNATPPVNGQLGQSMRLGNSATVQPYTFNDPNTGKPMTDEEMVAWMQQPQTMYAYNNTKDGVPYDLIPGEWNHYGNMGMKMMDTVVVGVTVPSDSTPNGVKVYRNPSQSPIIGGACSFNNRPDSTGRSTAMLIDVNPEAPPASQVFTENLMLQDANGQVLFNAKPSKAITRWINFQRNVALTGPNGAAGTFQCVVPLSELQGQPIVSLLQQYPVPGKTLAGLVFRYTLFRSLQEINTLKYDHETWLSKLTDLYQQQGTNPTYVQLSGTIAPWYEGEMESIPTGAYLVPDKSFPSPGGNLPPNSNAFNLGPAIVGWTPGSQHLAIDLNASLPDTYYDPNYDPLQQNTTNKFNLGPLSFGQQIGSLVTPIGPIDYIDTDAGDAAGWIFDYVVPADLAAPAAEGEPALVWPQFVVSSPNNGNLLKEQRLFFASDQSGVFAEQGLNPSSPGWANMPALPMQVQTVSSQGYLDTKASFQALAWGKPYTRGIYELWMWNQTYVNPPAQGPLPVKINGAYKLGDPISIPTDTAGVYILTITELGASQAGIAQDFNMMTWPMINCRILPNLEYSDYYTFDSQGKPVATEAMDWYALYGEVFRNYYLLYPGMSLVLPLNDPNQWIGPTLFGLSDRVDPSAWNTMSNMPRTRDMSATRRWLVQAYCNKFANQSPPANTVKKPV